MAEEKTTNAINFGEEFDKQEFGLIDDGRYEVVIEKIEPRTSLKTGNKYLNFTFTIRGDVDQKFKNRKLFYTITKKEGDSCYDFSRINKIILTQKKHSDYKSRFMDFDEVLQYLHGIHLVLTVETNFDDYKGEDRNTVKDWSFEPSLWDMQDHSKDTTPSATANPDIVEDSDLPF